MIFLCFPAELTLSSANWLGPVGSVRPVNSLRIARM